MSNIPIYIMDQSQNSKYAHMNLIIEGDPQLGNLWLGDRYAARDVKTLIRHGIKTVLTMA